MRYLCFAWDACIAELVWYCIYYRLDGSYRGGGCLIGIGCM